MDKKSILIGIFCLGGGFALMFYNAKLETEARQHALEQEAEQQSEQIDAYQVGEAPAQIISNDIPAFEPGDASFIRTPSPVETVKETTGQEFTLENDVFQVNFSTLGGAIKTVLLKKYPKDNPQDVKNPGSVVLNNVSDTPALALKRDAGNRFLPLIATYEVESVTDTSIQFVGKVSDSLAIRRYYEITREGEKHELYSVQHRTEFINTSDESLSLQPIFLNLGTAAPTDADYRGFNLNAGFLDDGDYDTIQATKFSGGGFLFWSSEPTDKIVEEGSFEWGAVKNQFFTTIYTPSVPASTIVARAIKFPPNPSTQKESNGITAALKFNVPTLQPNQTQVLEGSFYAGSTDFDALSKMGNAQEDVMQLGWFLGMFLGLVAFVAKVLLTIMSTIHDWVGNWGVAIIVTTLVIRLLLYPLTAKAARAAKRMQKLSKPMQEIREKYKDNQQKANQEIMTYMKKHRINPLSGCWPVLIQFPIFIAFFNLLRNSSDLRFAEFLWIHDLSMPDATIQFSASLPFIGSSLNVLPFIWLVSMILQMRMMPSPSVDNAQVKLMKWMPLIFFPFTYFFSSGLVIYWTTTNTFSIFQQWMTNRIKDEEDVIIEEEEKKKAATPLISKKKKKKKK